MSQCSHSRIAHNRSGLMEVCASGRSSGAATSGISSWWAGPVSPMWNEADMVKMAAPSCTPVTRRVQNERPSRMRSTRYTVGCCGLPGRRK
ncbi:Uncharacterised protein [Mycobacteroides abscessus subsp. abscessus]|nr:Uncharacterised protein [Mycobacteroides abscessus subsp. abscessus]